VARAAKKRQAKTSSKSPSAAKSRKAKPRVKRAVAKRAAKPARKAAVKKAARKVAVRKVVVRKAAVRKVAVRKAAIHRAPVVPVPPAFAIQRAGASAREQLLFEMQRARATVKAAIQGMSSGSAMQPIARGKWSPFEIVLHLSERDRVRLEEIARTLGGLPRTWAGIHDPAMKPINEAHLAPLRAHTWDEAVRRLDSLREELLQRLYQVPEQPDDVWQHGHAFGDMMWGLPEHDRHHAEQIKRARIRGAAPVEV
jgi:hypothetical protein